MKKAIISIFICLCAVFVMSHNVSALDLTQDVNLIQGNHQSTFITIAGLNMSNLSCNNNLPAVYCVNTAQDLVVDFSGFAVSIPNRYYEVGDYITIDLYLFNNAENNSMDAWVRNLRLSSNAWDLIDVKADYISSSSSVIHITTRRYNAGNDSFLTFQADTGGTYSIKLYYNEGVAMGLATVWRPKTGANYTGDIQNVISAIQAQPNYTQNLNNINNSVQDLQDSIEDRNEQEDEALDNISNQTPSDISTDGETENQATTNLIGLFSSFISALGNITQAQNCNLTLNFPSYAGGTLNVNVCQYKDKAGNLISVFSSLTLIVFYIPLALKLLSMIYNEIRSFTNG